MGVLGADVAEEAVVEVVPVTEVASLYGVTVQRVKDELHKLTVNGKVDELPPGKYYKDRWFDVQSTTGTIEVILYCDVWYLEPIFRK